MDRNFLITYGNLEKKRSAEFYQGKSGEKVKV